MMRPGLGDLPESRGSGQIPRPSAERIWLRDMFSKTTDKLKAGFQDTVSMPVKQSMMLSIIAIILAIVALVVKVAR